MTAQHLRHSVETEEEGGNEENVEVTVEVTTETEEEGGNEENVEVEVKSFHGASPKPCQFYRLSSKKVCDFILKSCFCR